MRLNALCGTVSWKSMPFFCITLFQRPTPATVSRM